MKKNLLLTMLLTMILQSTYAQQTNIKNIVGVWSSKSTSTKLVFFFDNAHKLQLVEWDSNGGEEMMIQRIAVNKDTVSTTEKFASTNHVTRNKYYLKNDSTLVNTIRGDSKSTIYFTRRKWID